MKIYKLIFTILFCLPIFYTVESQDHLKTDLAKSPYKLKKYCVAKRCK